MGFIYQITDKWDGESPDPHDKTVKHKNHDSAMGQDEVLRLAKAGVDLLLRQPLSVVKATNDKPLRAAWDDLQRGKDRTSVISVLKGIHQRRTKPHITARVVGGATLHVWLSATDTGMASLPGFTYSVIAVSATERGGMVPPVAVAGIRRRGSVSYTVMENEKRRIAAEAAEAAKGQDKVDALAEAEV
ncbi:MAG: hypothetical protein AB7K86_06755 [Rhodospirillales bacterium]